MPKKARYSTERDYIPELVRLNEKRLLEGLPIITEGSPEYKSIIKNLKNKTDAKHIAGVLVIQAIFKDYDINNKNFDMQHGGQAIGIGTKADRKEEVMYV